MGIKSHRLGKPTNVSRGFTIVWAFFAGTFTYFFILKGSQLPQTGSLSPSFGKETPEVERLADAWRSRRETCKQWISMQSLSHAYLDAYVIGSQKGASSELARRLENLHVRRDGMEKDWQYFEKMDEYGRWTTNVTPHWPVLSEDFNLIRFNHYKRGFPNDANATVASIPVVDPTTDTLKRVLAIDASVESFHSDKAPFLAHALNPHAKIIGTVRDPIDRALSEYNMFIRNFNVHRKEKGQPSQPGSREHFHQVVANEIARLTRCGYDAKKATLDRPTQQMLTCFYGNNKRPGFNELLFIYRGLYHIHLKNWRSYFPDHRILLLPFTEITGGKREMYQDLAKFLCVRPFPDETLDKYERSGSSLSHGQQVAKGMQNKGPEAYEGDDAYVLDVNPSTRKMLNDFFRPANIKLEAVLGRKMFEYE